MSTQATETPAPGTGGDPGATTPDPSAGTLNPETQGGPTPETIPYSRFKEVNDRLNQLKPYEALTELGYDPDSLGQLAAFEQAFVQDEVGTMKTLVANSTVLTDEQKAEMSAALEGTVSPSEVERNATTPSSVEEPPEWAKPLIEDHSSRQQTEANDKATAYLDSLILKWNEADVADKLKPTPRSVQLAFIATNAPYAKSEEQLLGVCRQMTREYQTSILSDALAPASEGISGSLPRAVPGGGAPVSPSPTPLKDLKSASAAARTAIEAGLLPAPGRR